MRATETSTDAGAKYTPQVRQLLTIGETETGMHAIWPDYVAGYGLTEADGPELLRVLFDQALADADPADPVVWAEIHAWRALGQLRLVAAVGPLLDFAILNDKRDDDTATDELPTAFGLIGAAAIPMLADFLNDPSVQTTPATIAMYGLNKIAARHPEHRATCIGILVHGLQTPVDRNPSTLGFAVGALLNMGAVEAIDPIREAFRQGAVDISIVSDIEDVEIELGLRKQRATPRPHYMAQYGGFFAEREPHFRVNLDNIPVESKKIGRNDPCSCGSGKKYKKCCLP